jgi:hypothetical protein
VAQVKNNNNNKFQKPDGNIPTVRFLFCPLYKETFVARCKSDDILRTKLNDFLKTKGQKENGKPVPRFGSSDKPFSGDGNYSGLLHAHLNGDMSIVYSVSGANPTDIKLYGIFSHDDLGTGQPSNKRKQVSTAQKFKSQPFSPL